MLNPPSDPRVWEAIARLDATSNDFKLVKEWLAVELERRRYENDREVNEVAMRMGQGGAQALDEFLVHVRDARKRMTEIKEKQAANAVKATRKASSFARTV